MATANTICGAYAPVPTPLTEQDQLEPAALTRHLAWLAAAGLDGALILGSNGEFASLSLAERLQVAAAAAAGSSGLSLVLNIGSCALPDALELLALAGQGGYDAVLCPPPFYFRNAPVSGLAAFFHRLLDAARLPVLLYHIPQLTGITISTTLLELLADHQRLAGVKDSSGDPGELHRLCTWFAGRGSYLVGHDRLVSATRQAGGAGSISAVASVQPGLVKGATENPALQPRLDRVRAVLDDFGLGPPVKAVLRHLGLGRYWTRPPLQAMAEQQLPELLAALTRAGADLGDQAASRP